MRVAWLRCDCQVATMVCTRIISQIQSGYRRSKVYLSQLHPLAHKPIGDVTVGFHLFDTPCLSSLSAMMLKDDDQV